MTALPPRYRIIVQCLTVGRLLTRTPWLSLYDLAERTDLSSRTVRRHLDTLRAAGMAIQTREGHHRRTEYRIARSAWCDLGDI